MLFFLEYDLRNTRNYDKLYAELQKLNAVRVLESTYCFERVNIDAEGLVNYFRQFIDADDGICVTQVADWCTYNTNGTPKQLRNVPR